MPNNTEEILSTLLDSIKGSGGVVIEETQEVLQQVIGSALFNLGTLVVVLSMFTFIVVYGFYKLLDSKDNEFTDQEASLLVGLLALSTICFTLGIIISVCRLLSIYLYPKAYLLERFVL